MRQRAVHGAAIETVHDISWVVVRELCIERPQRTLPGEAAQYNRGWDGNRNSAYCCSTHYRKTTQWCSGQFMWWKQTQCMIFHSWWSEYSAQRDHKERCLKNLCGMTVGEMATETVHITAALIIERLRNEAVGSSCGGNRHSVWYFISGGRRTLPRETTKNAAWRICAVWPWVRWQQKRCLLLLWRWLQNSA